MFEKFTEKAINVVTEAQEQAKAMHNAYVQPEHLLLAIVKQAKGISLKLFKNCDITFEKVQKEVETHLRFEKPPKELQKVPFGPEFKNLLKNTLDLANKSGNYVLFEHLFLVTIEDKLSYNERILERLKFDVDNAEEILSKLVQKKSKKLSHPEAEETKEVEGECIDVNQLFEDDNAARIFKKASAKLSTQITNYEMLGTEQILSVILDDENSEVTKILDENGINSKVLENELSAGYSRQSEYDEKNIILTPSALSAMTSALQIAKELGSSEIKPEHMVLGILKSKKGVAFDILKKLNVDDGQLTETILKPIEKEMPQALTILKLAKQETRRLGRNIVGTEMILLGILNEGNGIGFKVLNDLGINIKDVRQVVETLIGYGNEYYDKEIVFTKRAKKILETAWSKAKKYNRPRIMSEHLLYAIASEQKSIAMKALEHLGVDAVEIRQGILKEIEG